MGTGRAGSLGSGGLKGSPLSLSGRFFSSEFIPTDGVVIGGRSSINEAPVSGESIPVANGLRVAGRG